MKKNVPIFLCLVSFAAHGIGIRQLQAFNDAKKEVEQSIAVLKKSDGRLSEAAEKTLEKNLLLIASVDKKVADGYRAQIPQKEEQPTQRLVQTIQEPVIEQVVQEPSEQTESTIIVKPTPEIEQEAIVLPGQQAVEQSKTIEERTLPATSQSISQEIIQKEPVFSVTSSLPAPVVMSEPKNRETPVTSTQSTWQVPILKAQKGQEKAQATKKVMSKLSQLETAIEQSKTKLTLLDFGPQASFTDRQQQFSSSNKLIDNYLKELDELKSSDKEMYQEKMKKVQEIQILFATKLCEQTLKNIEFIRTTIEPVVKTLQENGTKKKSSLQFFSRDTEFQNASYEFFFGKVGKKEWQNTGLRKNLGWFKGNYTRLFAIYWKQGLANYDDLLFEYYKSKKFISNEQAEMLKAKIGALRDEIHEYKNLIASAYNAMMAILNKMPSDDKKNQMNLIDKDYKAHIELLDESGKVLINEFFHKLWPTEVTISSV